MYTDYIDKLVGGFMDNAFSKFTNQYSFSKTLRFELVPQGRTADFLNGELESDQDRAESYQLLKPHFDNFHDGFIEQSLKAYSDSENRFEQLGDLLQKQQKFDKNSSNYEKLEKDIIKLQKSIRTNLSRFFTGFAKKLNQDYGLGDKSIISNAGAMVDFAKILWKDQPEKLVLLSKFDKFSGYFTGYCQNRTNYYVGDDKSTAVSNRIVNQNFTKYTQNFIEINKDEFKSFLKWFNQEDRYIYNQSTKQGQLTHINPEMFSFAHYTEHLNQSGIETYNFNIGDINYWINQFNQTKPPKKVKKLLNLYKQIGQIPVDKKELFKFYETDEDLATDLLVTIENLPKYTENANTLFRNLADEEFNLEEINISARGTNSLANKYLIGWESVRELVNSNKKHDSSNKLIKLSEKPKSTTLGSLNEIINQFEPNQIFKPKYLNNLSDEPGQPSEILIWLIKESLLNALKESKDLAANLNLNKQSKLLGEKSITENIKTFLDSLLLSSQIMKTFQVDGALGDSDFYNELDQVLNEIDIFSIYNATRNYLTKKPYSQDKILLKFANSSLLDGWDINKESDNTSVILRDSTGYFLAIMKKSSNKFFDKAKNPLLYQVDSGDLEKMDYKLLPGPNKMIPKCIISVFWNKQEKQIVRDKPTTIKLAKSGISPSDEFIYKYNQGLHTKDPETKKIRDKKYLVEYIDYVKDALNKYEGWQGYIFNFKSSDQYQDTSEFYKDISDGGYSLNWSSIDLDVLNKAVDEGEIYLFKLKNKDLARKSKSNGKPNLHTMYWQNLFIDESSFKLNGSAEMFYRPKSIDKKQKVFTGSGIKKSGIFEKNRFTENKYLFHVPITINRKANNVIKFRDKINQAIIDEKITNVIGVDRGEKHLEFYCLLGKDGEIIEQGSLNVINGADYSKILDQKSSDRNEARKNWKTIDQIKDIKNGHTSLAIKQIIDLAVKHNALIVLEDLNTGFMRGRQKIEKSNYQQFELAMAKKLNYLVSKDTPAQQVGGTNKGLQLTPILNNYSDIEKVKQFGIILYTTAGYTSSTDPVTGWRKTVYLKSLNQDSMKNDISKFSQIYWDNKEKCYIFSYDTKNFNSKANSRVWSLYSSVERLRSERNKNGIWEKKQYSPTDVMRKALVNSGINPQSANLKEDILSMANSRSLKDIIFGFNLICQIRNSGTSVRDSDYILSPVKPFFDSRKQLDEQNLNENPNSNQLPTSGDSNGAYNIARKGQIMLSRVKQNPEKPDLFISDSDWDKYLAED